MKIIKKKYLEIRISGSWDIFCEKTALVLKSFNLQFLGDLGMEWPLSHHI